LWRVLAAIVAFAFIAAACGDDSDSSSDTTSADGDGGDAGVLSGIKGTLPSAELTDEFKDRLLEVDPDLEDFSYGPETYDAVTIVAIAAEVAGTDDPIAIANEINGVTKEGEPCDSFEACKAVIENGGNPDYDGPGGPYNFVDAGEPAAASFAILEYGDDNQIDDSLTEYRTAQLSDEAVMASDEAAVAPPTTGGTSDGVLSIGTLLPETGDLAFLGPPEFAGAELAVQDINDAGGALGADVALSQGDSGDTNTDIANQTTDRLLNEGVDAIVGAASSGVSFTVIDKITGANVIHFSPANTSPDFTAYDDNGLYFRTAPSDVLQGQVLSDLILDEGNETVGLLAREDPYGEGLLNFTVAPLEAAGAEVTNEVIYDPAAENFDPEVGEIVSSDPDAIVVIGFEESAQILTALFEQGMGEKNIYLVDGNIGNALGENF
jgi:ABC-type branched-subunit amino acid transport system substrate-binding protein